LIVETGVILEQKLKLDVSKTKTSLASTVKSDPTNTAGRNVKWNRSESQAGIREEKHQ